MVKISKFTSPKKDDDKNISVYFRITHNSKSTSYFPGIKILPKFWDKEKRIIKSSCSESRTYNRKLLKCEDAIHDIETNFINSEEPYSVTDIKSSLEKRLNGIVEPNNLYISKLFEDFLYNLKINNPSKGNSNKNYISTYKKFVAFEEHNSAKYTPRDINKQLLLNFKNFLFKGDKLQNSTVQKHIKRFKTFIAYCSNEGIEIDKSYKQVRVKVYDVRRFILTRDEIKALKEVELISENEIKYRDLFIIQCYLGIRISDLKQINENNIDTKEHTIDLQMEKSDKPFVCAVPEYIIPLVRKYFIDTNDIVIKDTDYNRIIKKVCMKAGITTQVEEINYYNNKKVKSYKPKYEVVTTHTARRNFITYMFKTGKYSVPELMLVTRHTSIKEFMKYLIFDDYEVREKARSIANNDLYG